VEASALPEPLNRTRAPLSAAFLRLRSDDQLVALFRAGSDDAFRAIHDRYRARLLAYARQMLHGGIGDPEDTLQDVFMRAHRALRASDRPVTLRAWLYRIAHNRCIDELRRPCPLPSELAADAQPAFTAPAAAREAPAVAERNAALSRLVADVQTLPSQQRSALLMRELQGLSYEELGGALGVSVPAVKSLLLRARTGLIDIQDARDTPCVEIREELIAAADRGVRISGRARRHCGECRGCETYRSELKRVRRGFAALTPAGPLGQLGMLFGLGGGGAAAASGGGAAAGGGVIAGATAAKIAVAVCCAALITTAGGAVIASSPASAPKPQASHAARSALAAAAPVGGSALHHAAISTTAWAPAAAGGSSGGGGGGGSIGRGAPRRMRPGVAGATGATGPSGAVGVAPATGATGVIGATGASGATGATGASGAAGASSATITVSVNGIGGAGTDDQGMDGATAGATGLDGATGASGATGAPAGHAPQDGGTAGPTAVTASAPDGG